MNTKRKIVLTLVSSCLLVNVGLFIPTVIYAACTAEQHAHCQAWRNSCAPQNNCGDQYNRQCGHC